MPYFVIWVVFNNSGDIILVHVVSQLQLEKICLRNKGWSNSGGSPGFTVCDWLMFCKISFALTDNKLALETSAFETQLSW